MRAITRQLVTLAVLVVVLVLAICAVRTVRLRSRQVPPAASAQVSIDISAASERLAALIRVPAVSWGDASKRDVPAFDRLSGILTQSYPRLHRELSRETLAKWSLLYSWPGTRPDLPPLILVAHLDVVPVESGTETRWTHPPFAGAIAEGSIWGRGAIDDKSGVAGLLEAGEALLASGFRPARTVYFAFGHNEEGGGDPSGAAAIAAALEARGVRHASVLDEGGLIIEGLSGVAGPVALVGVSEKTPIVIEVIAHAAGGHASMPPRETAVGILARALDRIERHPLPPRLDGPTRDMFNWLAPEMAVGLRAAIANLWLTRPLVERLLVAKPETNAMVRTTFAPTMLEASPKVNVLAAEARAAINVRLLPGDTAEAVAAYVRSVIDDARVEVRVDGGAAPAPVTDASTPEFAALAGSIRAAYPDVVVAPYLTMAATDSRAYGRIADRIYRFLPIYQDGALEMIHGTNEHVRVDAYEKAIRVYATAITQLAR